jgi:hypothetical protein
MNREVHVRFWEGVGSEILPRYSTFCLADSLGTTSDERLQPGKLLLKMVITRHGLRLDNGGLRHRWSGA